MWRKNLQISQGKKVISFVLWGNDMKYTQGAIENAEMANSIYPGWETRIVVHVGVKEHIVSTLKNIFNTVIMFDGPADYSASFRRYDVMLDEDVDVSVFRDCDSRLCDKAFQAVREWLSGNRQIHAMRDHKYHEAPIMAGMWGIKKKGPINVSYLCRMINRLCIASDARSYGGDEFILNSVAKTFSKHILSHSSKSWMRWHDDVDFPAHKPFEYGTFVGEPICIQE